MLNVVSTTAAYRLLADVPAGQEREAAWVDKYEAVHSDIFSAYYSGFGDPSGRPEACARVGAVLAELDAREDRVLSELQKASDDFTDLGLIPDNTALDVVLMVGTGDSDAWVDVLHDRPTLFVALEMLREPPADGLLAVHELVHVVHMRALWSSFVPAPELRDHVGLRVWAEGLAVAGTRLLRPGHEDSAYLFADGAGWIRDCERHAPQILDALRARLDKVDAETAYALCGVTNKHPWPSRAGYWLGDLAVRQHLAAGHGLGELLRWDVNQIVAALDPRLIRPDRTMLLQQRLTPDGV